MMRPLAVSVRVPVMGLHLQAGRLQSYLWLGLDSSACNCFLGVCGGSVSMLILTIVHQQISQDMKIQLLVV